ncbi:MAG: TetR/AcrR family transcriptional regulator [candidate division Zixibacteria bacterium]|nr:TetR/AcrR family transcriptional regulator [candidate division Zixibacteria bacterium]
MDENVIVALEKRGVVSATFRKLEPVKKKTIYKVVLAAFAEDIFESVSLEKVALAAGISKGSLIQYFMHKGNLLEFAGGIFLDDYRRHWDNYFMTEYAVRAKDRIANFMAAHLDYWDNAKTEFKFFMKIHYENSADLTKGIRNEFLKLRSGYFSQIIGRGMETGEIRRDMETEFISLLILASLKNLEQIYAAALQTPKTKVDLKDLAAKTVMILFDGIGG